MQKEEKRKIGQIEYTLTYKKIKRLNLRIKKDASIAVRLPLRVPKQIADEFVLQKREWIEQAQQQVRQRQQTEKQQNLPTKEQAARIFEQAEQKVWALIGQKLNKKPTMLIKDMETRWGVCYPQKYAISLSRKLALKPTQAIEYVILHEYVHFFHPNHQKQFWQTVETYMPDWKQRRSLLRQK